MGRSLPDQTDNATNIQNHGIATVTAITAHQANTAPCTQVAMPHYWDGRDGGIVHKTNFPHTSPHTKMTGVLGQIL